MAADVDMIIKTDACDLPFGLNIRLRRQRSQRRLLDGLEQHRPRRPELAHGTLIEPRHQHPDRRVQLCKRGKPLVSQRRQDPALRQPHARFDLGLVPRTAWPGIENAHVVVRSKVRIRPLPARLVEARLDDHISSPAPGSTVDPETSWNYEAGVRYASGGLSLEAVGYFNDYDNLVGSCTASTGGGCNIGDQFEGGAVEVRGLELMAGYDVGDATGWGVSVPLSLVYTFTDAEFGTSFASAYEPWGAVAAGDELPYTPEHQLTLNAGLVGDNWRLNLAANHVSEAHATAGSGAIAASDRIDARTLLDIAGAYALTDNLSLFATVTNLTDEVYNVAFSPAGARPGAPQTFMAGIRTRF